MNSQYMKALYYIILLLLAVCLVINIYGFTHRIFHSLWYVIFNAGTVILVLIYIVYTFYLRKKIANRKVNEYFKKVSSKN